MSRYLHWRGRVTYEAEIDGVMVLTHALKDEIDAAIAKAEGRT